MRKTTTTLTTLVAAGALTAFGLALAPTAMAAVPSAGAMTSATSDAAGAQERGREGHGSRGERPGLETVMTVLDLTEDELKAARDAGTTLAELAEQQGVQVSTLIDALVAEAQEHLAEHVADGDLTQQEADDRLADIEQRITDRVNGVEPAEGDRPDRGERPGGPGAHGPHGPHGPGAGESADDEW
ncbi:hypothetical protein [Microcella sp.]|uniref:hypothetical protein n=1 Tax=Microcella sp. TaxID=1913979 RepID=UPI003F730655